MCLGPTGSRRAAVPGDAGPPMVTGGRWLWWSPSLRVCCGSASRFSAQTSSLQADESLPGPVWLPVWKGKPSLSWEELLICKAGESRSLESAGLPGAGISVYPELTAPNKTGASPALSAHGCLLHWYFRR